MNFGLSLNLGSSQLLGEVVQAVSAALTGLTGGAATSGVQLGYTASNLPDGVTVTGQSWRTATSGELATTSTYTPNASVNDLENLFVRLTLSDASTVDSPAAVIRYAVDPTVSLSVSSATVANGTGAGSVVAVITTTNTSEIPDVEGATAGLYNVVGTESPYNLELIDNQGTDGTFGVSVTVGNSRPASAAAAFSLTVLEPSSDVILSAVSTQQFTNITPIDFSASVPSGSRAYCIDAPEGMEVMSKALRVIGAPTTTQSATTMNIRIDPPSGDDFWVTVDVTVTASADTTYNNGGSGYTDASFITGLSEFGTSYTGAGCVVELAAGATIDISGVSGGMNGRFRGLSSPIIIKSIDPSNPATITGKSWSFATTVREETGNVSFVDLVFDVAQTGADYTYSSSFLPTASCLNMAGQSILENVAAIRCTFRSDVAPASDKTAIKQEMSGVGIGRDADRVTVFGCTFTELFNGMLGTGSNTLFAQNQMHDCWGDMFRCSTGSDTKVADYILSADNYLYNSVSDGLIRHADGVQIGGSGAGGAMTNFERRGDVTSDTTKDELPAIAPGFSNSNAVEASTNQTASATDDVLYRLETDVAAGDLSLQLPDISTVASGWECCAQKYSADTDHTVTVLRDGADTIDGGTDYAIDGKWMAVRFFKNGASATDWTIQIYSPGVQHGLYQDDGGLDSLDGALIWHCAGTTGQFAGHRVEVDASDFEIENCTLVPPNYGDVDGDGSVTPNDFAFNTSSPAIVQSGPGAMSVTRSTASFVGVSGGAGTIDATDNDTSANIGTLSTITARYTGGGSRHGNRLDAIRAMRHLKGGPLDGTGRGAIGIGMADIGYDFINMRPQLPGAPTVTTAPVIAGTDAAGFTISTAAVFSSALTPSYQWLRDGEPISGATSATYAGDTGAADGSKVSLRVTGASVLGDAIADSTNEIEKPVTVAGPTYLFGGTNNANSGSTSTFTIPAASASGNTITAAVWFTGANTITSVEANGVAMTARGSSFDQGGVTMQMYDIAIDTASSFDIDVVLTGAFATRAVTVFDAGTQTFNSLETYTGNNPSATNGINVTSSEASGSLMVFPVLVNSGSTFAAGTNVDTVDESGVTVGSYTYGALHQDAIAGGASTTYAVSWGNIFKNAIAGFAFYS